ncbi:Serine Threonine protein kinase [Klebsormidium nitens]|uniref:non-specific serine/threonine protein kinase n=1 Tax=Klebsormidium nitens TaxID=105231 RepID=A0A1Y1I370_KLENI|nr:Serine Threonine protein kinase [Klebsormidium nitens]|eukprot:GAQ84402.1 Serine Threonine protein kinase [Klebsormidium nitens]
MAITALNHEDGHSDTAESEEAYSELPRKSSFSQLLARYLGMGFLSCFGIVGAGPEEKPRASTDSDDIGALRQHLSQPQEVPQDDFATIQDEPYAKIVESFGPENSVPASFRTSFLGADFDNEFSLTNGVKWQVWQQPGELTQEAVKHFESRSAGGPLHPSPAAPLSPSLSEVHPELSPHSDAGPDLSPHADGHSAVNPPPGEHWQGRGETPEALSHGFGSREIGVAMAATTASSPRSRERQGDYETDMGLVNGENLESSCSRGAEPEEGLDTSDGAALLSKLGAPHTIPLTPEIEEELRRSNSFQLQAPPVIMRGISIGSPFSTPGSEAAGLRSGPFSEHLFRSNTSPGTHTKAGDTLRAELLQGDLITSSERSPPLGLMNSQSATAYGRSSRRSASLQLQRSDSLRSEDSLKRVKETHQIKEGEDVEGHKTVNQYVKLRRLGTGSYGKVVLHKDSVTGKLYAMKILHRSRLMHVHISGEETAWTDVLREIAIMKQLDHPNLVTLQEVIDDPDNDKIYMVLEYEEKGPVFEGTGPEGGVGEERARAYTRDVLAGLQYLHYHNIVHGDIKPENLMMSADGRIKIGDFGVSHIFENENDQLRRTPGTPAFTAPECCMGVPYHGKPADMWALGVTLYVFVTGQYPFLAQSHSLADLYQAILHEEPAIPAHLPPPLQDLLRKLLEKDPSERATAEEAARHPWLTAELGPLPQVELRAIDVDAEHVDTALTRLDDESKSRLARLFARHAAAVWRKKASALARDSRGEDSEPLSRTSSIRSADAYDSDFSAPSSRYGSPKRDREPTTSPLRMGSSRFGGNEKA